MAIDSQLKHIGVIFRLASHFRTTNRGDPNDRSLRIPRDILGDLEKKYVTIHESGVGFLESETEDLVDSLNLESPSLGWICLDAVSFSHVAKIILFTEPCFIQAVGLFRLLDSAERLKGGGAVLGDIGRCQYKNSVGEKIVPLLVKCFAHEKKWTVFRRWAGLMLLELLETKENRNRAESSIDGVRSTIGKFIVRGLDKILKFIAGQLIFKLMVDINVEDARKNYFHDFMNHKAFSDMEEIGNDKILSLSSETQWNDEFYRYVDIIELRRDQLGLRSPMSFYAIRLKLGSRGEWIGSQGTITCNVTTTLSIHVPPYRNLFSRWLDIDMKNIEEISLSTKGIDGEEMIDLILRLKDYKESSQLYLLDMEPYTEPDTVIITIHKDESDIIAGDLRMNRDSRRQKWDKPHGKFALVSRPSQSIPVGGFDDDEFDGAELQAVIGDLAQKNPAQNKNSEAKLLNEQMVDRISPANGIETIDLVSTESSPADNSIPVQLEPLEDTLHTKTPPRTSPIKKPAPKRKEKPIKYGKRANKKPRKAEYRESELELGSDKDIYDLLDTEDEEDVGEKPKKIIKKVPEISKPSLNKSNEDVKGVTTSKKTGPKNKNTIKEVSESIKLGPKEKKAIKVPESKKPGPKKKKAVKEVPEPRNPGPKEKKAIKEVPASKKPGPKNKKAVKEVPESKKPGPKNKNTGKEVSESTKSGPKETNATKEVPTSADSDPKEKKAVKEVPASKKSGPKNKNAGKEVSEPTKSGPKETNVAKEVPTSADSDPKEKKAVREVPASSKSDPKDNFETEDSGSLKPEAEKLFETVLTVESDDEKGKNTDGYENETLSNPDDTFNDVIGSREQIELVNPLMMYESDNDSESTNNRDSPKKIPTLKASHLETPKPDKMKSENSKSAKAFSTPEKVPRTPALEESLARKPQVISWSSTGPRNQGRIIASEVGNKNKRLAAVNGSSSFAERPVTRIHGSEEGDVFSATPDLQDLDKVLWDEEEHREKYEYQPVEKTKHAGRIRLPDAKKIVIVSNEDEDSLIHGKAVTKQLHGVTRRSQTVNDNGSPLPKPPFTVRHDKMPQEPRSEDGVHVLIDDPVQRKKQAPAIKTQLFKAFTQNRNLKRLQNSVDGNAETLSDLGTKKQILNTGVFLIPEALRPTKKVRVADPKILVKEVIRKPFVGFMQPVMPENGKIEHQNLGPQINRNSSTKMQHSMVSILKSEGEEFGFKKPITRIDHNHSTSRLFQELSKRGLLSENIPQPRGDNNEYDFSTDGESSNGYSTPSSSYTDNESRDVWSESLPEHHKETQMVLDQLIKRWMTYFMSAEELSSKALEDFESKAVGIVETFTELHAQDYERFIDNLEEEKLSLKLQLSESKFPELEDLADKFKQLEESLEMKFLKFDEKLDEGFFIGV